MHEFGNDFRLAVAKNAAQANRGILRRGVNPCIIRCANAVEPERLGVEFNRRIKLLGVYPADLAADIGFCTCQDSLPLNQKS